jgi:hypothetical protein
VPARLRSTLAAVALVVGVAFASGSSPAAGPTLAVFPAQGVSVASPNTQISFRGAPLSSISGVKVSGSSTGSHSGALKEHSDHHGASFLPNAPFKNGEKVTVRANQPLVGQHSGVVTFTIAKPPGHYSLPTPADEGGTPPGAQIFHSNPGLNPPSIVVSSNNPSSSGDIFVAAKAGPGQDGSMISEPNGALVWFKRAPQHQSVFDFRTQTYHGNPVLTYWEGRAKPGQGLGRGVILDDSYHRIGTVQAGNGYRADLHEFEISRNSTGLILAYNPVTFGGSTVMDTIVQEIDIPTKLVMFEWHTLGQISHTETYATHGSGDAPFDIAHLNSLQLVPSGQILVSARNTNAIYALNHTTAQVDWRLGGKKSDFSLSNASKFISQHHVRLQPDGSITLFDNGAPPKNSNRESRALWLDVNGTTHKVHVRRSYRYPTAIFATSQGSMQALPGGNVFVGWGGNEPFFTEFNPSGNVVLDAHFNPRGDDTYRAYRFHWHGQPTASEDPPDIAASRSGGTTHVWASWNGATKVARWQVLTGPSSSMAIAPVGTFDKNGFETHMTPDNTQAWVAVQALDGNGTPIGTSKAIQPSS